MRFQPFYAIVVNGVEAKRRTRIRDARYHANKLRAEHGQYNVWLRTHYELVPVA